MSKKLAGIVGIGLIGLYSVIMMATSGTASYGWLILAAAIGLVVVATRQSAGENDGD